MKDFHTWVSEQANSIEDKSTFLKGNAVCHTPSPLQIRMQMADLLMPDPSTEIDVHVWVQVFCICLDDDKDIFSSRLSQIIGGEHSDTYYRTETDQESLWWLKDFKEKVNFGRIKLWLVE